MPTYEFRCPKGHEFEKFYRSIGSAPSEVHCPECGELAIRRLSGGAGLVFKGSGFYLTDYGKNAHRKSGDGGDKKGGKGDGGSSEGGSGDSGSGDSKGSDSKTAESKSDSGSTSKSETKS